MEAKNLGVEDNLPTIDWTAIAARLDMGVDQGPDSGGPNRHTTWLVTINPDGRPHITSVGALWVDGAWWFQTGNGTRKAKNVARDPRCALSVSTQDFDLVVEGEAHKVTDPARIAEIAARWAEGGWPARVDDSGRGITAEFNAPAVGPPPWYVYKLEPRAAAAVSTIEPGGSTRWVF